MKIGASIDISAPIDKVFDIFSDLGQVEKNIDGIKNIEVLEGQAKMQLGTRWRETRVMFGKEATEEMTVSELVKDKKYVTDAASHGMKYTSSYTFEEIDNGTKVTMEFDGVPVTFAAKLMLPIGWLFKGATKKALVADMTDLKKVAENEKFKMNEKL